MQRHRRAPAMRVITAVLVCLVFSFSDRTWAQYTGGRVEGTVADPTGAFIADATVRLLERSTNNSRMFTTMSDGHFVFFALPPGDYVLSVEAPGFTRRLLELAISSNQAVTQNVALELGRAATVVEVRSLVGELTVSNAQRSVTRSELELSSLPLLGRNMISVVQLGPGISPTNNPRGGSTFGGGGSFVIVLGVQSGLIAANGGRARATSVQLDYTDANDWEAGGFAPGMQAITPDMLQEFKVLTSNFSAEYGVKSSAQVIMVTKSGSNGLHGSAYDFIQNDFFNARDYFDTTGSASPLKQNVYGFTLGGPVLKDRTFFFGGYEGRRTRGGSFTTLALVPSEAARAKATDPAVTELMDQFLPLPTAPTSNPDLGTVAVQIPSPIDNYQFIAKVDHQLSEAQQLSARYLQGTASFIARYPSQNTLPGFDVANHFELRNANLAHVFTLNSRTVNEFRLAYSRTVAQGSPQNDLETPRFLIGGVVNFGSLQSVPASRLFNIYQLSEVLSHVHRKHILRAGVDLRWIQDDSVSDINVRGVFSFASLNQFLTGHPASWTQLFGNTHRAFRTSLYGLFAQDDWKVTPTLTVNTGLRWEMQGALTEANGQTSLLDPSDPAPIGAAGTGPLGSFRQGGDAVGGNYWNLAPRIGFAWNPRGGKFVVRGGYGIYWDSFTFSPLAAARSAPPFNYTFTLGAAQISGPNSFDNLLNGTAPVIGFAESQVGSFGTLKNFGTVTTIDSALANPYVQQFSLGIEHRMPWNSVLTLAYVGTKSTGLTRLIAINPLANPPLPATSVADESARIAQFLAAASSENGPGNSRVDPRFDQVNLIQAGGSSTYHSLQAELKKTLSHGIQFQASYTWSKSIDNASDFSPTIQANDNGFPQDSTTFAGDRSVSNFDITHRVVVTGIWRIPFARNLHGVSRTLLHGWSFESVNMWQSGIPATLLAGARAVVVNPAKIVSPGGCAANPGACVTLSDLNFDGNLIPTGADNTRADCNPGATPFSFGDASTIPPPEQRGANGGPNSSNFAFAQPLLGNNGTCGRNNIRMNSLTNFDWSLFKEMTLRETGFLGSAPLTLQLRAEAYNVFNVPFLTAQSDNWRTLSSSAFGRYNAAGSTRRLQFAVRLTW